MGKSLFNPSQDQEIKKCYLSGKTGKQIANQYGCYEQSVLTSLKRTKTPRRTSWARASGEKNGHWKGGIRWIKGYKHILLPEHHLARADGYVAEHRLIAEIFIGRRLKPTEVVNHKDANTKNNDPSNLEVFVSNGEHIKMHNKSCFVRDTLGRWVQHKHKCG
jgi:hypothetical protein